MAGVSASTECAFCSRRQIPDLQISQCTNVTFLQVRKLRNIAERFENMAREILEERRAAVVSELKAADGTSERTRDLLSLLRTRFTIYSSESDWLIFLYQCARSWTRLLLTVFQIRNCLDI